MDITIPRDEEQAIIEQLKARDDANAKRMLRFHKYSDINFALFYLVIG